MHDVVSRRQIQTLAPGTQTDQKDIPLASLERIDALLARPRGCAPVEILVRDPSPIQQLADDRQVIDELAEYEHLVPARITLSVEPT